MRETVIPMSRAASVSQRTNRVTCCPLFLPPSYSSPTWCWDSAVIMCDKSQHDDNRPYSSTNTMWWLLHKTQKLQIRCSYVLLLFVNALDVLLSRSRTSPAGWRQVERMEEGFVVVEWPAVLCSVSLWNFNHRHLGGHLLHFTSLTVKDVLAWAALLKHTHARTHAHTHTHTLWSHLSFPTFSPVWILLQNMIYLSIFFICFHFLFFMLRFFSIYSTLSLCVCLFFYFTFFLSFKPVPYLAFNVIFYLSSFHVTFLSVIFFHSFHPPLWLMFSSPILSADERKANVWPCGGCAL